MGLRIIKYGGYSCDKCGHKWVTKNAVKIESSKDVNNTEKNKPKICPKCKSPKWNYLGLKSDKLDKEFLNLYPEEDRKLVAEGDKINRDISYRIKKVKEEIEKNEKDIKWIKESISRDKSLLALGNKCLNELREELKDLERINKRMS